MNITKFQTTFFIIILSMLFTTNGFTQKKEIEKNNKESIKINLYYFIDNSKTDKYNYFSYIIPISIKKELNKSYNIEATTIPVTFKYIEPSLSEKEKKNYQQILAKKANESLASLVIIGSYIIENNKIIIKSQIYNVKTDKLIYVSETEAKKDVVIKNIIEKITKNINDKLQDEIEKIKEIEKIEKQKKEEELKLKFAKSPFIPFYSALQNFRFGYSYQFYNVIKNWNNLYKNPVVSSLFIGYPAFKLPYNIDTEILLNWRLFTTNNKDLSDGSMRFSTVNMFNAAFCLNYQLLKYFSFSYRLYGGIALTKIDLAIHEGEGPFTKFSTLKSQDPVMINEILLNLNYYNFILSAGAGYNMIFYLEETYEAIAYFFELSYKL